MDEEDRSYALVGLAILMILLYVFRIGGLLHLAGKGLRAVARWAWATRVQLLVTSILAGILLCLSGKPQADTPGLLLVGFGTAGALVELYRSRRTGP